jgi:hypothetical protein
MKKKAFELFRVTDVGIEDVKRLQLILKSYKTPIE